MVEKKNNGAIYIVLAIIALLIGLTVGSMVFPQTQIIKTDVPYAVEKEVVVTQTEAFDYSVLLDQCPICDICVTTEVTDISTENPFEEMVTTAWTFIEDEWKDGDDYTASGEDFEDILGICDGEDYDFDEIDFDIEDEVTYQIKDYDKNKAKITFKVEGEYDNECEEDFKIEVEYYKNRDPEYTITVI